MMNANEEEKPTIATMLEDDEIKRNNECVCEGTMDTSTNPVSSEEEGDESKNRTNIPEVMQCEEVDMNDPKMDPLEWSVRKTIPIPKKYYWEVNSRDLPAKTKIWHNTVWLLGRVTRGAERAGEAIANFTGLNASRYDYVTSTMTDEEWKVAEQNAAEQKARRRAYLEKKDIKKAEEELAADTGVTAEAI
mmetsp:Transcript_14061/g.20088  ORF Transcript_14061/g.20088 Transcript_14061/m.20088 type:complete len:190 (+) Transcript_14061:133-702(+)